MMPLDFIALAQQCAPHVSPVTMAAIVRTESGFNPYAIGVMNGRLVRQPASLNEAVATAHALSSAGWNFSVGLAQVNLENWYAYGLNERSAFDPCRNLAAGAAILQGCFESARRAQTDTGANSQSALHASLSCYASGNFSRGYRTGYVQRVVNNARISALPSAPVVVPPITPIAVVPIDSKESSSPVRPRTTGDPIAQPGEILPGRRDTDSAGSAVVF
ncbi:lytic transglycosylase domain-containing protein [Paraburkholderia agricolaris]|uniref:lytic transglycosylase domain-containing protein n=1 Tax=Paraburkholderia agricolaris TaxID=2152888 RepID=UPI0012912085|nr:lytic transglycosylase domain-containing protein [Paraburkholderia agricolaris]